MLNKLTTRRKDSNRRNLKPQRKVADSATFTPPPGSLPFPKTDAKANLGGTLSAKEKAQLRKLESVLKRNEGKASLASALALHQINVNRLYRGHSNSMKKYGALWDLSPAYTSRLVKSGEIYTRLLPFCRSCGLREPTSAWQLRPLIGIRDPTSQETAWRNAVTKASGRKLTATMVESSTEEIVPVRSIKSRHPIVRIDLGAVPGLEQRLTKEAKRRRTTLEKAVLQLLAQMVLKKPIKRALGRQHSNVGLPPVLFGLSRSGSSVLMF